MKDKTDTTLWCKKCGVPLTSTDLLASECTNCHQPFGHGPRTKVIVGGRLILDIPATCYVRQGDL